MTSIEYMGKSDLASHEKDRIGTIFRQRLQMRNGQSAIGMQRAPLLAPLLGAGSLICYNLVSEIR